MVCVYQSKYYSVFLYVLHLGFDGDFWLMLFILSIVFVGAVQAKHTYFRLLNDCLTHAPFPSPPLPPQQPNTDHTELAVYCYGHRTIVIYWFFRSFIDDPFPLLSILYGSVH